MEEVEKSGRLVIICVIAPFDENILNELEMINELYDQYLGVVDIYTICNILEDKEIEKINNIFKEKGYDFKLYFDFKKVIIENYNIIAVPTTIFLDKNLNTVNKIVGDVAKEEIVQILEEYLDSN